MNGVGPQNLTANALRSATTVINVSAATAPTAGQVLKAVDSTHATWQADSSGGGTVTSVSVVSANGLAGSVATPTTTPAITLSTSVTQNVVLKAGAAGAVSASGITDTGSQIQFAEVVRFVNDAWNTSVDGKNRLFFLNSDATYFGTGGAAGYIWQDASGGNSAALSVGTAPVFSLQSDGIVGFSSSATDPSSVDTGIGRNGAGVVEVNTGSAGVFRDIIVRDAFLDGEKSLAALATNGSGKIVVAASDARLKTVQGDFTAGLEAIKAITPKCFTWNDERQKGTQAGLIAQDLQEAIPLAVSAVDDEMGTLQIHTNAVIGALINACQELAVRVAELESKA